MSSKYARRKSWIKRDKMIPSPYGCGTCDYEPKASYKDDPENIFFGKGAHIKEKKIIIN